MLTDNDGRFVWTPNPAPPFEMLVILPGGMDMKPVFVERLGGGVVEVSDGSVLGEVVTVSGSAPSIETTPAAGTATLTATEIQTRPPANLVQALENIPGINQVSEGQAAVPAIRGLARGRTLILSTARACRRSVASGPARPISIPTSSKASRSLAVLGRSRTAPTRLAGSSPSGRAASRRSRRLARALRHTRHRHSRSPRAVELSKGSGAAACSSRPTPVMSKTTTVPRAKSSTPASPITASSAERPINSAAGLLSRRLAERLRP